MARRRYAPIQSEKKETTWSNLGQNASTPQEITILKGVVDASLNVGTEAQIGSKVPWLYLEFHFSPASTGNANVIHWFIAKKPFDTELANPNLYYQVDKRFIIKRGMEMLPVNVSTVFKRIIAVKVPRHLQRLGRDDTWVFKYIASSTETINACGFSVCKPIN